MRFEIGDIVRIAKNADIDDYESEYCPRNRNGKIIKIDIGTFDDYPIQVEFEDVDYNLLTNDHSVFKESELKLVRRNR